MGLSAPQLDSASIFLAEALSVLSSLLTLGEAGGRQRPGGGVTGTRAKQHVRTLPAAPPLGPSRPPPPPHTPQLT